MKHDGSDERRKKKQGKKKRKEWKKKKKKGSKSKKKKHKHQITCNFQPTQQYAKQSNVKGKAQGLQSLCLHKK